MDQWEVSEAACLTAVSSEVRTVGRWVKLFAEVVFAWRWRIESGE
jgi:hypothetical protein